MSNGTECPECGTTWPDHRSSCPGCGLTWEDVEAAIEKCGFFEREALDPSDTHHPDHADNLCAHAETDMALPHDRFEVTEDHLKLLRAAYIGWDGSEFGAPAIDAKRPYRSGDVLLDIHEILTGEKLGSDWDDPPLTEEQEERYRRLHRELQTVLQIAVQHTSLAPGLYEFPRYRHEWEPVADGVEG